MSIGPAMPQQLCKTMGKVRNPKLWLQGERTSENILTPLPGRSLEACVLHPAALTFRFHVFMGHLLGGVWPPCLRAPLAKRPCSSAFLWPATALCHPNPELPRPAFKQLVPFSSFARGQWETGHTYPLFQILRKSYSSTLQALPGLEGREPCF